ncbi:SMP-30/gluconolactonase/LRE family protein [Thalassiella azotivora]
MDDVENVTGPVAHHAEGPCWSPTWGGLRFVDLTAGDLLTLHGDRVRRRHVGEVAAFVRPRSGGGFVVALERTLALAGSEDDELRPLPPLWEDPGVRFNDGGCLPSGTLFAGSMAYDGSPGRGALLRVGTDLGVAPFVEQAGVANGFGVSPDGSRAYWVDSTTQRVDVFDVDGDALVDRRPFAHVDAEDGTPDGLAVDAEGGVWVALFGGSVVRRHDADGRLDAVVPLPVSQVTACAFGGEDLDVLYVTTSRQGLPEQAEPQAGSVFAVTPGCRGLPVLPFGG